MSNKYDTSRMNVIDYFHLNSSNSPDDYLLKRIHMRRGKKSLPDFCKSYLFEAFFRGNDVRFFNEFLWLSQKDDHYLKAIHHFKSHLNEKGYYNYCYDEAIKPGTTLEKKTKAIVKEDFKNTTVGLIGTPFHFITAYFRFKKMGIPVDIINVKYHKNKKLNLVLNTKPASLIYRLIFGRKRYLEIDISDKKELKGIILPKKYDIGFHKLTFIISENLINQFRKGLINDHWGPLPLFKGRSTLAYSKLFGVDLVVTNHLTRPEIDSGDIICFTPLKRNRIRWSIYMGLESRIIQSLGLLASNGGIKDLDNSKGKVFYEMHPWLLSYIKKNI